MSGFEQKLCHAQRDRFLLLKTISVEQRRAGQHGICILAWGAMEVLTSSWICCGRVGSKRTVGAELSLSSDEALMQPLCCAGRRSCS